MERKNAVCADGPIVEGEKKGGAAGGMLILCSDTEETGEVVRGGRRGGRLGGSLEFPFG